MEKGKLIVACDMDGVIVDNNPRYMEIINATFGTDYTIDDLTRFDYGCFPKHIQSTFLSFWNMDWIYDDIMPTHGALTTLERVRECGHRVVVASTPLEGHVRAKLAWLRLHNFPKEDVVLIHDKHLLQADILIEDGPHNMVAWLEMGRPLIAYIQPYNREEINKLTEQYPSLIFRAWNWEDVHWWLEQLGAIC